MVNEGQKSRRLGRQRELLPGEASRRAVAEEAGPAARTPGRGARGRRGQAAGAPSGAAAARRAARARPPQDPGTPDPQGPRPKAQPAKAAAILRSKMVLSEHVWQMAILRSKIDLS